MTTFMNDTAFMDACASASHFHVHRMLEEQKHTNNIDPQVIKDAFQQICCVRGIQSIAQIILEQMPSEFTTGDLNLATRNACENGHLEIAQWLTTLYPVVDVEGHHEGWYFCDPVFYVVCLKGHLEVAQWLFSKQAIPLQTLNTCIKYLCTHAVATDTEIEEKQRSIAEWLYLTNPLSVQEYIQSSDYLVIELISIGNITLLKWLYEKKQTLEHYELCFYTSCIHGQLKVAQWLYSIYPEIDVSINNEKIFCDVCIEGHLGIAQWLLQIKPTIRVHTRNHIAIKKAHSNNHQALVRWLVEQYPSMYSLMPVLPLSTRLFLKIYKVPKLPFGNPVCTIIRNHCETSTCTICCEYDCCVELNCKHSFCENCISTWYDKQKTCPLCRTSIVSCKYIQVNI